MKKQLIKEIDDKGDEWYFVSLDGKKVTMYTQSLKEAEKDFAKLKKIEPSKTVIKQEEV